MEEVSARHEEKGTGTRGGEPAPSSKVIGFFGNKDDGRMFREFSNFYSGMPPYEFTLPDFAKGPGFPETVTCEFSEKTIMLCKAALMGDQESFQDIAKSTEPKAAKAAGRNIKPFDQETWDKHLEEVAFEVARQKFASNREIRDVLLSTGDAILAEATRHDSIWGIGIDVGEDAVNTPEQWKGRNVQGFALMRAREHLRGGGDDASAPAGTDQTRPRPTQGLPPPGQPGSEGAGGVAAPAGGIEAAKEAAHVFDQLGVARDGSLGVAELQEGLRRGLFVPHREAAGK